MKLDDLLFEKVIIPTIYGELWQAESKDHGPVAVKVSYQHLVEKQLSRNDSIVYENSPVKEYDICRHLQGVDRIMPVLGVCFHDNKCYMVMPLGTEDLLSFMERQGCRVNYSEVQVYFRQIVEAVHEMHKLGVVHLDLSLENIVLHNRSIYITDFGLAQFAQPGDLVQYLGGKRNYAAPEMVDEMWYNGQLVDVFALGVMLFTLLFSFMPFDDGPPTLSSSLYQMICEKRLRDVVTEWKIDLPDDAICLLEEMLCRKSERITTTKILEHPFLHQLLAL
jgi:serine/threonine protein kinase